MIISISSSIFVCFATLSEPDKIDVPYTLGILERDTIFLRKILKWMISHGAYEVGTEDPSFFCFSSASIFRRYSSRYLTSSNPTRIPSLFSIRSMSFGLLQSKPVTPSVELACTCAKSSPYFATSLQQPSIQSSTRITL